MYYKLVKVTIDAFDLAEVIIDIIISHHGPPDLTVTNIDSLFTSKVWSLLCYFFKTKRHLSTVFHP